MRRFRSQNTVRCFHKHAFWHDNPFKFSTALRFSWLVVGQKHVVAISDLKHTVHSVRKWQSHPLEYSKWDFLNEVFTLAAISCRFLPSSIVDRLFFAANQWNKTPWFQRLGSLTVVAPAPRRSHILSIQVRCPPPTFTSKRIFSSLKLITYRRIRVSDDRSNGREQFFRNKARQTSPVAMFGTSISFWRAGFFDPCCANDSSKNYHIHSRKLKNVSSADSGAFLSQRNKLFPHKNHLFNIWSGEVPLVLKKPHFFAIEKYIRHFFSWYELSGDPWIWISAACDSLPKGPP